MTGASTLFRRLRSHRCCRKDPISGRTRSGDFRFVRPPGLSRAQSRTVSLCCRGRYDLVETDRTMGGVGMRVHICSPGRFMRFQAPALVFTRLMDALHSLPVP